MIKCDARGLLRNKNAHTHTFAQTDRQGRTVKKQFTASVSSVGRMKGFVKL